MNIALSLIMAGFRGTECLDKKLASLERQSLQNFELFVLGGHVEPSCAGIVERYQKRGLRIRMPLRHPGACCSQEVAAALQDARGGCIGIIKPDSMLPEDALEAYARIFQKEKTDFLNVSCRHQGSGPLPVAGSFAVRLGGREIFRQYLLAEKNNIGSDIKIFSKNLACQTLPFFTAVRIPVEGVDFALTSILLFYAESYAGNGKPAYGFFCQASEWERLPGEIVSLYRMLHGFVPYIAMNGCPLPVVADCAGRMQQTLHEKVRRMYELLNSRGNPGDKLEIQKGFLACADETEVLGALLEGHPAMRHTVSLCRPPGLLAKSMEKGLQPLRGIWRTVVSGKG